MAETEPNQLPIAEPTVAPLPPSPQQRHVRFTRTDRRGHRR
jgi:hypothetical protein